MGRPYWYAYMQTKKWEKCFCKVEDAETEENLRKALAEMLEGYSDFIEDLVEDDGKWALEGMLVD